MYMGLGLKVNITWDLESAKCKKKVKKGIFSIINSVGKGKSDTYFHLKLMKQLANSIPPSNGSPSCALNFKTTN